MPAPVSTCIFPLQLSIEIYSQVAENVKILSLVWIIPTSDAGDDCSEEIFFSH